MTKLLSVIFILLNFMAEHLNTVAILIHALLITLSINFFNYLD